MKYLMNLPKTGCWLFCFVMLNTACKNESKWIPQLNEYNQHWQSNLEAGYQLDQVYMDSAGNAWAISNAGIIRHRAKGEAWRTEDLPVKGVALFCIGGRQNEVWVAGEDGTILYKKKNHPWTVQKQPAGLVDFKSIYVSEQDLYLVGSWETILHKTGNGEWIKENKTENNVNLVKIKGSPDNLYIVGAPCTILHKTKGSDWIKEKCPPIKNSVTDLLVMNNDVYISGDSGLIMHKTGNQSWVKEKTPVKTTTLLGMYGWENHVWTADIAGTILHKDGQGPWTIEKQFDNLIFSALYGKQHDLWIAGYDGALVHKHENDPWVQETTDAKNTLLLGLTGNEKEMIAVGLYETIMHRNDKKVWTNVKTTLPAGHLLGVYAKDDEIWVPSYNKMILHKKGNDPWQQEPTGVLNFELKDGYRFGDECWLIGKPGTILHKKGKGAWEIQSKDLGKAELNRIYGYKDELWVVGSNDIVLHKKSGAEKWVQDDAFKHFTHYFDIIGSGDDLWAVGDKGTILHKKRNDSTWQQEAIDPQAIRDGTDWHLHAIRKQGTDMWAAGSHGIILHKKGNQSWKRILVNLPLVEFKYLEVDDKNIYVAGIADKKGIVVYKQGDDNWRIDEFPGRELSNIILHKGLFILTSTGYLYKQSSQTEFVEKKLKHFFKEKVMGAAVMDTTLYIVSEHAITGITPGEKQYPILAQMRYTRSSWFSRDTLEIQIKVQLAPKGKRKDLRALDLSLYAKPYNETQETISGFVPVKGRFSLIDTASDNIILAARFEVRKTFRITPSSDAANKLMVRLNVYSESAGMDEAFILKDEQGHSYLTILPLRLQLKPWQKIVIGILLLYLLPYLFCWRFFPLRFLRLHGSNFFGQLAGLHAPVSGILTVLHRLLTLNGLPYSTHVQNNLLKAYKEPLDDNFLQSETTKQKSFFVPLPLRINDQLEGELINKPDEKLLQTIFRSKQSIVQIIGQGGAGKTTLAIAIGRWIIQQQQPANKIQIPVIIESETTDLVKTITEQFKAQLDLEYIPEQLIVAMLKNQRLVVIIDALSERTKKTRDYIKNIHNTVPVNALIITTRYSIPMQVKESTNLYLSSLDSKNLMHFITANLAHRGNHPVKTWQQQIAFARAIVLRFERNHLIAAITPILVKLMIDNALCNTTEDTDFDTVINSIPHYMAQVFYQYLFRVQPVNKACGNYLHDDLVIEVAGKMGTLSVQKTGIPHDFKIWDAQNIFQNDPRFEGIDPIQRFIDNGIISRHQKDTEYLRFNLDTLAEYVAAGCLYDEHQNDPEKLKELFLKIDQLGQEAAGFKQAFEQVKAFKTSIE